MIKIQVQAYSDFGVSQYSWYNSEVVPALGNTIKIRGDKYEVTNVMWIIPEEDNDDHERLVNEVHVSARKI